MARRYSGTVKRAWSVAVFCILACACRRDVGDVETSQSHRPEHRLTQMEILKIR